LILTSCFQIYSHGCSRMNVFDKQWQTFDKLSFLTQTAREQSM
jgi:hypothetical protein